MYVYVYAYMYICIYVYMYRLTYVFIYSYLFIMNVFLCRGFTFYKMTNLDNRISNADQLLTQDVVKFCDTLGDLYSNICKVCIAHMPTIENGWIWGGGMGRAGDGGAGDVGRGMWGEGMGEGGWGGCGEGDVGRGDEGVGDVGRGDWGGGGRSGFTKRRWRCVNRHAEIPMYYTVF